MDLEELQRQLREARRNRHPAGQGRLNGAGQSAPMRVALGADHGGFALKQALVARVRELGHEPVDLGTHSTGAGDYPDFALAVAKAVASGDCARGIVVDAAGLGSCMVANKVAGVRAATCHDEASARNSREHNDANVLSLGSRALHTGHAKRIVQVWLATPFAGGRHQRRVEKIEALDRGR
jgi:ribose 5-phosphate isomerase B